MNSATWLWLQVVLLGAGTVSTGTLSAGDWYYYLLTGGELTQFRGTPLRNPLLTTCFWGAVLFAVALGWAVRLLGRGGDARKQLHLAGLLLAGTLLAAANIGYRCFLEIRPAAGDAAPSCMPVSRCLVAFSLYVVALLMALAVRRALLREEASNAWGKPGLPLHHGVP